MIDTTVSAGYSLSSSYIVLGTEWIRLTQVEVVDTATKSELAALIDRVYGVTPCTVNADDAKPTNNSVFDNTAGKTDIYAPPNTPPVEKSEFNN